MTFKISVIDQPLRPKSTEKIESIQSAKLAVSAGPFSTGVKANGFFFLSGQVGIDQDGNLVDDFDLEVRQILNIIGAVLSEQKLTFDNIVSVTIYLKDMQNFKRLNDIYKTYFTGYYPDLAEPRTNRFVLIEIL